MARSHRRDDQGSANHSPPRFVNTVALEPWFTSCLALPPSDRRLSCCDQDHTASNVYNVYDLALYRESAGP